MTTPRHCVLVTSGLAILTLAAGCRKPAVEPVGWQPLATGSTASLRGLAVVDAEVAFVGGGGGTLLRTLDGGRTWTDVAPADSQDCDFRDLEAFDRDNLLAMVAGQPARVYRSHDGGGSWRIAHEDARPAAFFDAMAFCSQRGMLFGDVIDGAFTLLATTDEGRSWQPASAATLPPPGSGEAGFAASGTCVAATEASGEHYLLVTGGGPCRFVSFAPNRRPKVSDLPLRRGNQSSGAFGVAAQHDDVVVVGGDYRQPELSEGTAAWSADGGASWQACDAGGFRSAVAWLSERDLLAVGSHGASRSHDGGRTWRPFGEVGFHSIAAGGDGAVWACGSDGRVARLIVAQ